MADLHRQAIAAAYFADEARISAERIAAATFAPAEIAAIGELARDLVGHLRQAGGRRGGIEALTQEYAL